MSSTFCGAGHMMGDVDEHMPEAMAMHGMQGGTVMYMSGFRFTFAGTPNDACLNLFFPSWTLDTRVKFVFAMIFAVGLGVATEFLSAYRVRWQKRFTEKGVLRRKLTIVAVHGTQMLAGYLNMLLAMTYSIEMLMCIVSGLAIGHAFFSDGKSTSSDGEATTGSTPCCNISTGLDDSGMTTPLLSQEGETVEITMTDNSATSLLGHPLADAEALSSRRRSE